MEASVPEHHTSSSSRTIGPRFRNPWETWVDTGGPKDVVRWHLERRKLHVNLKGWLEGNPFPKAEDFKAAFPLNPVDWSAVANPPANAIQALWVGHATLLVQMAGVTFLTDPCFFTRCSPVRWTGPKRKVPAAFKADDPQLPALDFVLISHNHFDHLQRRSVQALYKRFGDTLTWYVPLGVKAWFKKYGIKKVVELDWWQEVQHPGSQARLIFVPAQHWSQRTPLDKFNSLWGGWVVKSQQPPLTFYFSGDSGYCPVFDEIGKRMGPMDLSALPIGAYEPRWFNGPQHVAPEETVQIHRDVRSKRSLAIHCCTWSLTDEALDEPPRRLAEALANAGLSPDEFVAIQHGEMIRVADGSIINQPKLMKQFQRQILSQAQRSSMAVTVTVDAPAGVHVVANGSSSASSMQQSKPVQAGGHHVV